MSDSRARYIRDHAPLMLLYAAQRRPANEHLETDLDRAIRYAGALYDRLTAAGHTPDSRPEVRPAKTRKTPDHLATLAPDQVAAFERFYRAYGVLKGKQRAAARWAELNPDADLARRICAAAAADAAAPRPADAIRKYPEGWLSERRWEDIPVEPASSRLEAGSTAALVRELLGERRHLVQLIGATSTSETNRRHLSAQLEALEARLDVLGATAAQREGATPRTPRNGRPTPLADLVRGIAPAG